MLLYVIFSFQRTAAVSGENSRYYRDDVCASKRGPWTGECKCVNTAEPPVVLTEEDEGEKEKRKQKVILREWNQIFSSKDDYKG